MAPPFLLSPDLARHVVGKMKHPLFTRMKFCANRSAYKNAYQIIVHIKNLPKINLV
jgi:hypothetical protein